MITSDGWLDWADRAPGPPEKVYSEPCTSEIYLPHSMVGRLAGWYSRLFDMSRDASGRFTPNAAASVTGSILLAGRVIQHYPLTKSCWASGGRVQNVRGNAFENESQYTNGRPDETKPFTPAQVQSNLRIIFDIAAWKGWTPRRPVSVPEDATATLYEHNEAVRIWGGGATSCPSDRAAPLWAAVRELTSIQQEEDDMAAIIKMKGSSKTYLVRGGKPQHIPSRAVRDELQEAFEIKTAPITVSQKTFDFLNR